MKPAPEGEAEEALPDLYARRVGAGPPMVFVHGFAANSCTWDPWVEDLSRDHTLHLLDLKGFGRAPKPTSGGYAPTDLAAPVARYVRDHDLEGVTLVGHSLGGAVAMLVGLDLLGVRSLEMGVDHGSPPSLARLVIVSGAVYPQRVPPLIRMSSLPWIGPVALGLIPPSLLMGVALRWIHYDRRTVTGAQVERYAAPLRQHGARGAVVRAARSLVPEDADEITALFPRIPVPVLALWGRHDRVVPLSTGQRLSAEVPDCQLTVLERCGHIPPEEQPDASLAVVRAFLEEHPLAGR